MALEVEGSNPFVHPNMKIRKGLSPFFFTPRFGKNEVWILRKGNIIYKRGETLNWKILIFAFCTLFIAELGDKTQLAVFSLVSQSKAPWEVFIGASLALALVTLIGVLFGETVTRCIPPFYLRLGAAFLFIGIGIFTLWRTLAEGAG